MSAVGCTRGYRTMPNKKNDEKDNTSERGGMGESPGNNEDG
jgi:hypothetical protein